MFDSLESQAPTPILLFTDTYKVRGKLRTRQRRLTDVLNAEDTTFLVLEDVTFEELGSGATIHRAPYAQVNLNTVLFGVSEQAVEAPPDLKRIKVPQQALISLPPFTIRGHIHLSPEPNLREALSLLQDRFIPVTESWYWSEYLDEARTQSPMVAFNHSRAQILAPYEGEADVWEGLGGPASSVESAWDGRTSAPQPNIQDPTWAGIDDASSRLGPDPTWEGLGGPGGTRDRSGF